MKKKFLLLIAVIIGSYSIYAILFNDWQGWSKKIEIRTRVDTLRDWQNIVSSYSESSGKKYFTLYDVYLWARQNKRPLPSCVVSNHGEHQLTIEQQRDIILDPELFNNLVQYDLLIGEHNWYIIELHVGYLYRHKFMIDRNNVVSEINNSSVDSRKNSNKPVNRGQWGMAFP